MTSFHKSVSTAKKSQEEKENSAVAKLEQFLFERRAARQPVDDLEKFERELHSLFATAEAEVVGHEVNRFDVDRPFVTVNGVVHHQVLRCEDTYFCASGPVQVCVWVPCRQPPMGETASARRRQSAEFGSGFTLSVARRRRTSLATLDRNLTLDGKPSSAPMPTPSLAVARR